MDTMKAAEIWTVTQTAQGNAALLRPLGMEVVIPIYIGQSEAQSILVGLGDTVLPRPLTHDLFMNLLPSTGLDLSRVEIVEIRNETFYARLVLTGKEFTESRPLNLDARPSDALALAVRRKCPVYIAETVIQLTGIPAELIIEAILGDLPEEKDQGQKYSFSPRSQDKRETLLEELDTAVAAEEYERAAEIRDMLIRLDRKRYGRSR
jgi:bifunctional DNase/RNase